MKAKFFRVGSIAIGLLASALATNASPILPTSALATRVADTYEQVQQRKVLTEINALLDSFSLKQARDLLQNNSRLRAEDLTREQRALIDALSFNTGSIVNGIPYYERPESQIILEFRTWITLWPAKGEATASQIGNTAATLSEADRQAAQKQTLRLSGTTPTETNSPKPSDTKQETEHADKTANSALLRRKLQEQIVASVSRYAAPGTLPLPAEWFHTVKCWDTMTEAEKNLVRKWAETMEAPERARFRERLASPAGLAGARFGFMFDLIITEATNGATSSTAHAIIR